MGQVGFPLAQGYFLLSFLSVLVYTFMKIMSSKQTKIEYTFAFSMVLKVCVRCAENVLLQYFADEFTSRVTCEGDQMQLRCDKGMRLAIYSSMFGRSAAGVGSSDCPAEPYPEAGKEIICKSLLNYHAGCIT